MRKIFTLSLFLVASIVTHAQMRYARGTFNGSQVVPQSGSTGVGIVIVKYNSATKLLQLTGNYRDTAITVTDAHVHSGDIGVNGPVVIPLTQTGGTNGTVSGSQILTATQEADFLAGRFYVDVHTTGKPAGEVRAQLFVIAEGQAEFLTARLQGAQVNPPNGSTATGVATVLIDKLALRLYLTGSFSGLTSAAYEIYVREGVPGTNGPVIYNAIFFSSTSGTLNTTKVVSSADLPRLLNGNIYIDINNSTYPTGEIRGQLTPFGQRMFAAGALTGAKEVPANSTRARGTVIVKYNTESNLLELTGDYQGLSNTISGSHIHGPATTTGTAPVLYPIANTGGTMGTLTASVTITETDEADLLTGNLYVNVHSQGTYSEGEIRAQLIATTSGQTEYLTGVINASQSVASPAVVSSGTGSTTVLLDKVTRKIYVTASYSNLASGITNSHIHRGAAGTNGPVVIPLYFIPGTTSGTVTGPVDTVISATLADSIINGFSYLNIHTTNYPGGEIRAQLGSLVLPVKLSYFNGFKDRSSVALIWESAQEINVKNYEVEQQNDVTGEWNKKGSISANGGNTSAKYRFDDIPTIGKKEFVLYRLKMVDQQGLVT
ncbi:MAG: CHRD domain-containing protein, partial [Segetibacter sp.]